MTAPNGAVLEARNTTDGNGQARVSIQPPLDPNGELLRGVYQVDVTFKGDTLYEAASYKKTITVLDNRPPVVSDLPDDIKAPWGVPIEFGGQATDPSPVDNAKLQYHWDFGVPGTDTDQSLNQKTTFAYPAPGAYTATLTVTDDKASATDTATVTIQKRSTNIKYDGPISVAANDPVRDFVLTGKLVDHVGDALKGRELSSS